MHPFVFVCEKKTKNPQGPVQNPNPDPGFYRKYLFVLVNNAIYV